MGRIGDLLAAPIGLGAVRLLGRGAVLAKFVALSVFLSPDEFGAASVAFSAVAIVDGATNPGYVEAYVSADSDKAAQPGALGSLATIMYGKAAAIAILSVPFGLAAGYVTGHGAVTVPVAIGSFGVAARATLNPRLYEAQRAGLVAPLVATQSAAMLLDAVIAPLAVLYSPRADVALLTWSTTSAAMSAVTYAFFRDRSWVRPRWNSSLLRSLRPFARQRFGSTGLAILAGQIDDVLVARLFGLPVAGLYGLAYRVAHSVSGDISSLSHAILFPRFSRQRRQSTMVGAPEGLTRRIVSLGGLAAFGSAGLLLVAADVGLDLFSSLSAQFAAILLASGATVRLAISLSVAHRMGMGDARTDVSLQIVRLMSLVVLLFAMRPVGVVGAAIASSMSLVLAALAVRSDDFGRSATRAAFVSAALGLAGLSMAVLLGTWTSAGAAWKYLAATATLLVLGRGVVRWRGGAFVG